MDKFSYLSNADVSTVEGLYQQYLQDPKSVDEGWARFFEGFEFAKSNYNDDVLHCEPSVSVKEGSLNIDKEFKVLNLIHGYRTRGHLFTKTNPVRERRKYIPTLDIENFGLEEKDLDTTFQAGEEIGIGTATLRDIIDHLNQTYCGSIGIEYMYIRDPQRQKWFRDRIELNNRPAFNAQQKKKIFSELSKATVFEQYLQKKFVGQKRFSIEGGEALIPALNAIVKKASD